MNRRHLITAESAVLVAVLMAMPLGFSISALTRKGMPRLEVTPEDARAACDRLQMLDLIKKVGSRFRLTKTGMAMMDSIGAVAQVDEVMRMVEAEERHASNAAASPSLKQEQRNGA